MFTTSASGLELFRGSIPTPPILYLRFTASLAVAAQEFEAKWIRYSFLVRLFHPLLHAGLSRRTNIPIALIDVTKGSWAESRV